MRNLCCKMFPRCYDKSKAPVPVVINPDNCIDHCHGCGKKCPHGAITYVQKINSSEKYKTAATILKTVMGTAILLIGLYMFWLAF